VYCQIPKSTKLSVLECPAAANTSTTCRNNTSLLYKCTSLLTNSENKTLPIVFGCIPHAKNKTPSLMIYIFWWNKFYSK
jgi:hypothetical protein